MTIRRRRRWARRQVNLTRIPVSPCPTVFIHHAVSSLENSQIDLDNDGLPDSFEDILRQIEDFHMDVRGWRAIAYNFLVGHKGAKAEGRGWLHEGGATGFPFDDYSISICAVGNYHGVHKVTPELVTAYAEVIAAGIRNGHLLPLNELEILGHRDVYATACPGDELHDAITEIRDEVRDILRRPVWRAALKEVNSKIKAGKGRMKRLRVRRRALREKLGR